MSALRSINVVIAGVGGQGNVVASELLASALSGHGYRVSVGETFGASQRGGSVMSHVRAARDATPGPLVPKGLVDVIVAFEPLEALRILADYGRETTRVLVNPRPVYPLAVQVGEARYPEPAELLAALRRLAAEVLVVESTELARQAGDMRAQNLALLGALAGSGWLPVEAETLEALLAERFLDEVLRLNRAAFRLGLEAARALVAPR
ncbi:MAG: indolepyruvate oxidoreductase subunit beta [Candidatus Rokubacteria bacterium]|nr:indolepyruvate oxidoreductase subunit beta [Candidatus Rokubacteria bacterium]MBI3105423.1 indolepyruvate oxidoreductase subunit beta [Candidatus Rokubacteria bacterium]